MRVIKGGVKIALSESEYNAIENGLSIIEEMKDEMMNENADDLEFYYTLHKVEEYLEEIKNAFEYSENGKYVAEVE